MDKPAAFRYIALEAWVLFCQLSSEYARDDIYEALLEASGIIQYRHLSTREKVNTRAKKMSKSNNKRSRNKMHRKRDSSDAEDSDDELLGMPNKEQGWLLSIDNLNSIWTKADLSEELTEIAVQAWLDWLR